MCDIPAMVSLITGVRGNAFIKPTVSCRSRGEGQRGHRIVYAQVPRLGTIFPVTTVISLMARYRGWVGRQEGEGVGGGGEWEAGGRLNLPLQLFGLAMGPRSASHRLNKHV